MNRHPISDDVLNITVGMRLEIGVSGVAVRQLIDKFAAESGAEQTSETVGFLWVEDIPHALRAEFLAAVSALPANPEAAESTKRMISVNEIWPSRLGT